MKKQDHPQKRNKEIKTKRKYWIQKTKMPLKKIVRKKKQMKERRRLRQRKKAVRLYDDFISRKAISLEPEQQERQKYSSEKYSTGELSQRQSIWQKAVS